MPLDRQSTIENCQTHGKDHGKDSSFPRKRESSVFSTSVSGLTHGVVALTLWALASLGNVAGASPFVNVNTDPELAALRPVPAVNPARMPAAGETTPDEQSTGQQARPADLPPQATLPPLVLNFVQEPRNAGTARLHFTDIWDRIRAGFALTPLNSKEVAQAEAWYAARPDLVKNILERSRYYLFHIVEELEKRGMPTELALLPFVESGFNPFALSSAQASGLWQFIPGTGTRYNLRQDNSLDERRDIIASTTAALDYLQDLHTQFGDWQLALASYNWGEKQVEKAIERNRTKGLPTDYASLTLPAETRNYVPRLLAVKQIVMSPLSFKVALPTVPNVKYFTTVARPATIDLSRAAQFADMGIEEFKALNAAYNRAVVDSSTRMPFVIPVGRAQEFEQRLDEFVQMERVRQKRESTKIRRNANRRM